MGQSRTHIHKAVPRLCDSYSWWEPQMDYPNNLTGLTFSFWGPYNRLGENFDLDLIGADSFRMQLDSEFDPNDPSLIGLYAASWFSYQLD